MMYHLQIAYNSKLNGRMIMNGEMGRTREGVVVAGFTWND
jgi:hypothetical protein